MIDIKKILRHRTLTRILTKFKEYHYGIIFYDDANYYNAIRKDLLVLNYDITRVYYGVHPETKQAILVCSLPDKVNYLKNLVKHHKLNLVFNSDEIETTTQLSHWIRVTIMENNCIDQEIDFNTSGLFENRIMANGVFSNMSLNAYKRKLLLELNDEY